MKRLLIGIFLALLLGSAIADQRPDSERDTRKFCYYSGQPYSKGSVILDQSSQKLTCVVDPDNPATVPPNEKELRWLTEAALKQNFYR
ncbi:DUF1496 domain-containing protein [Sulfuricella sp.]|uniref:DUF1496 domain-containing protein n=1 Tax=Sulfuricella sp. TaxID=2099377 RepID=UPI0039C8C0A2